MCIPYEPFQYISISTWIECLEYNDILDTSCIYSSQSQVDTRREVEEVRYVSMEEDIQIFSYSACNALHGGVGALIGLSRRSINNHSPNTFHPNPFRYITLHSR
ncbi:hypothetical protein TWF225_003341 [Orbilia oligospora]|uniref:Uncharacterized protein n=1 Tax=Orbilia oligospora TaxID=2813651 RepID=A0A7C8PDE6_ORBOL|nr:hypothetical protein TWF225_003341 [Orbilia oligospora]KAF3160577.1 hypothetical protein TWF225_003341 [Orbilia oligospora]KAF3171596.1 hypothetical protein TWF751_006319 [Orbilia oligospora]KAF3265802.1 hypothetical protein TWF217_002333 [Orbilia oligospora]TGJ71831.1 hypothetical protein EYR41_012107 [Orbilia oligospora]